MITLQEFLKGKECDGSGKGKKKRKRKGKEEEIDEGGAIKGAMKRKDLMEYLSLADIKQAQKQAAKKIMQPAHV